MDAHRPRNVLDLLLAHIFEGEAKFVAHLVAYDPAYANPAGFGQGFEPCRDIDPVAEDIASVSDYIAEIDPHTEFDAAIQRHISVSLGHRALHFDGAAHRVDNAGELDEQPVAGSLDDAATVLGDFGVDQFPQVRLQPFVCALLIRAHQP